MKGKKMRLKDIPELQGYKLQCTNCGSKKLRVYDPFHNWFTDPPHQMPNRLILECGACCIDIYPEEHLEKLEEVLNES